ncbi:SurA N-terminal domain-containing protein [Candidatus Magnetomoraceae bacterium gMMP-1]
MMKFLICLLCIIQFSLSPAYGKLVDRILAIVNNEIITLSDWRRAYIPYARRVKEKRLGSRDEHKMLAKLRGDILNNLIDQKLANQQIKDAHIDISDKEIDADIERIKKERFYTDEEFKQALEKQGLNIEEYRQQIKEQKLRSKLINLKVRSKIVITENDIKAYYESHPEQYRTKKKYHLRTIRALQNYESQKKMEDILKRLKAGESFESLARIYAEPSLAANGGDLGFFYDDKLSKKISDALKGVKEGEFTNLITTDNGYQIFFVEAIMSDKGKSIDEATFEIEEKLFKEILDKRYQAWLKELRNHSYIKLIK